MIMAVLLIRPRGPQFYKTAGPDLGFGFLLAALQRAGVEAKVVDLVCHSLRDLRRALRERPYSVVGFKLYSKDVHHFRDLVGIVREETAPADMPPLVVGGPLPTGLGADFLNRFPEVAFAFQGEAERGFPTLAKQIEAGDSVGCRDIPGLLYRDGNRVVANAQDFPVDLDALGYPDYSQTPPSAYPFDYTTGDVYVTVTTSRGCPYTCTYCGGPLANGRKLRKHSADYVVDQIEMLHKRFGVRMISFVDDNLTCDRDHAAAIFELLIRRNLGIRWRAPNGIRLDTLNRDLVTLMERSGCAELYLGVESGSPQVLQDMNRKVTVETYREKVNLLADNTSIRLLGFFILGYPTEREEDVQQTIELALELPLDRAAFFFFTPHPGTKIFEEMRTNGELPEDIWNSLFYDQPTLGTRHISFARLRSLQRQAYRRFFLRQRILGNLAASIRSPAQFARLVRKITGTVLRF